MSLEKLVPIGEKYNLNEQAVRAIMAFLSKLKKQNVITAPLMSRKTSIPFSKVETILPELVNEGILTYFIVVACENPDIDDGQAEHYQHFNSLKDYVRFLGATPCPVCDCGYPFGKSARIGYKIAR
ncbi:hypothetical protein CEB3_c21090 [Peptococcaceae bacterium CEB3]|nr:hypothetical protein CEB3_c21090 [Peptococcaceae bacterium CEB3]